MVKIGNASFHAEAIKKMSLKEFKDSHKDALKGQDLESVYKQVTQNKGPEKAGTDTKKNVDLG